MKHSVIALITLFCIAGTVATAQSFKAAFVNSETIMKELLEAQESTKKIEDLTLKVRDTLQMMQKDFETRFEAYRKQEAMMSAEAKRKEEETLNGLRTRFLQYQEEKTAEMRQVQEAFLKPIREKVQAAIAVIAKEEKLNMVLDKIAGFVLFSEDKSDITYKVLDRMKRGDK
jgi:outer membrane protein